MSQRNLFFLAFDHREAFSQHLLHLPARPSPTELDQVRLLKSIIFDAACQAAQTLPIRELGILCDEQCGAELARSGREYGFAVAMPAERSGRSVFEFEYGADYRVHIENFEPDYTKVLIRHNVEGDAQGNEVQLERLAELSDWLRSTGRRFLLELVVPPTEEQLQRVAGDVRHFDETIRPAQVMQAIAAIQARGIWVDIWKIEGVSDESVAREITALTRPTPEFKDVTTLVLGRAAPRDEVDAWLRNAARVDGFSGFAIGRSIWWQPLRSFLDRALTAAEASTAIANEFMRFVRVYKDAAVAVRDS
jgi:myo-inositol catabolism protein IolC